MVCPPTMSADSRLEQLHAELSRRGGDRDRIAMVERAQRFKRSWVEMAEALVALRDRGTHRRWGYRDLYEYCELELSIRRPTVDKLTGSYCAMRDHLPEVLEPREDRATFPSVDAVSYFAKVMQARDESDEPAPPDDESVVELRKAIFDDVRPVTSLRRTFNPVFFPKDEETQALTDMEKALSSTRRLLDLLPELDRIDERRRDRLLPGLDRLREDLESEIRDAREARAAREDRREAS